MKKIFIVLLAVILAACSAPAAPTEAPVAAPVEASPTPVVVVQTVVVEATQAPTEVPPPTAVPPTAVPPTVAPVVVTVVVQPTQAAAVAVVDTPSNGAITLDTALGRGVFSNMTMSSNAFTLRCSPRDITFNITTPNTDIRDVMFYYRVVDLKRLYPSEWKAFGKMVANGNGNFTLTFTGENIHPDIRIDGSWFDFQFVGLSKSGDAVDRSDKIEQLVKYTFDCP
jgi:hypothetical protein